MKIITYYLLCVSDPGPFGKQEQLTFRTYNVLKKYHDESIWYQGDEFYFEHYQLWQIQFSEILKKMKRVLPYFIRAHEFKNPILWVTDNIF